MNKSLLTNVSGLFFAKYLTFLQKRFLFDVVLLHHVSFFE